MKVLGKGSQSRTEKCNVSLGNQGDAFRDTPNTSVSRERLECYKRRIRFTSKSQIPDFHNETIYSRIRVFFFQVRHLDRKLTKLYDSPPGISAPLTCANIDLRDNGLLLHNFARIARADMEYIARPWLTTPGNPNCLPTAGSATCKFQSATLSVSVPPASEQEENREERMLSE